MPNKLIRISTIPLSLNILLKNQFQFLKKYYNVLAVASSGEDLQELKRRENIETKAIEIRRKISLFQDLISLWNLYVFFKKEKPLIVHSITPKAGLLSMIAAKMAKVPIRMHTFTGLIFPTKTGLMKSLLINMDKLLCRCATNIYPEGNGVKKDLINYKITKKELKILANGNVNGIDLDYFDPDKICREVRNDLQNELDIKKSDFVFIFIGRLVQDKGINELVKAFKYLKSINSKLLLVGSLETDQDPLLIETLKEITANKDIITVGFQKDVRPYIAISHALVFPSYREGFPNVVMQAGAMNLPSIVTDINGCNEIIIENQNGTIIPVKNDLALQNAMRKMQSDELWRTNLQYNARRLISERFRQQLVLDALLAEYQMLEKNVQKIY